MKTPIPTHSELVGNLKKDGNQIMSEMTSFKADLGHMAIGICGEAGELLDAIKKHVVYHQELDDFNVIEELGDIEFFLEGMRQILGVTREECLEANISKLMKRYEGGKFTNKAAKTRKDKKG